VQVYEVEQEKETYPLPGTKKNPIGQVDKGRNCYPTSFNVVALALISKKPQKSTPWDLTFSPRSLCEPAKSSKTVSWLPLPLPSSTRPSERTGVMTAPQARWLVPHRQRKSKEVGLRGGQRFRTTLISSRLAGILLAGQSSTAVWQDWRQQAGLRGSSLQTIRSGRSLEVRRPSSSASTGRRQSPSKARRRPS